MILKREQLEVARTAVTRAERREALIELWAQLFERELRADLEQASRRRDVAHAEASADLQDAAPSDGRQ
jgi:hypothetical protein